jgi:hypothetical protein
LSSLKGQSKEFKMPRGGKRPGAGRRPGTLSKKTVARQQLASAAAEQGISPLDVMLTRMRFHFEVADREVEKGDGADQGIIGEALRAAHEAAKDAAPYVHPRLSAIEHTGEGASPGSDPIGRLLAAIDGKTRSIPEANQQKMMIDVTPTAGPNAILDQVAAPAKTIGSGNGHG